MTAFTCNMPDHLLTECPHCGHKGDGLQWAFPQIAGFQLVQAACLSCGAHGPYQSTYTDAALAFRAGEKEAV